MLKLWRTKPVSFKELLSQKKIILLALNINIYYLLTLLLPSEKNICPKRTKEQDVKRFKSSAFAIFRVSLKYRLVKKKWKWVNIHIHKSLNILKFETVPSFIYFFMIKNVHYHFFKEIFHILPQFSKAYKAYFCISYNLTFLL